ncbi:MAG TPA: hypothetical protein VFX53_04585 [Pedococcus sp.]|nr:hypothetical protein [Pedococcus sp.]
MSYTMTRHWYALDRQQDVSDISSTRRVAYALVVQGVGVIMLWDTTFTVDYVERHSGGVEILPDLAMLRKIHCYDGKTLLTPLDEDPEGRARAIDLLDLAVNRMETMLVVLSGQYREEPA